VRGCEQLDGVPGSYSAFWLLRGRERKESEICSDARKG